MRRAALVASLALLLLAACNSGDDDAPARSPLDAPDLPTPIQSPTLTREEALVRALTEGIIPGGEIRGLDIQATSPDGADSLFGGQTYSDRSATAWAFRVRYVGDGQPYEYQGGPAPSEAYVITCRERFGYFLENSGGSGRNGGIPQPDDDCNYAPSADTILVTTARDLLSDYWPMDPEYVTLIDTTRETARTLLENVKAEGFTLSIGDAENEPVYFIDVVGRFRPFDPGSLGTPVPSPTREYAPTPVPTPPPPCRHLIAIVSHDGEALDTESVETGGCSAELNTGRHSADIR